VTCLLAKPRIHGGRLQPPPPPGCGSITYDMGSHSSIAFAAHGVDFIPGRTAGGGRDEVFFFVAPPYLWDLPFGASAPPLHCWYSQQHHWRCLGTRSGAGGGRSAPHPGDLPRVCVTCGSRPGGTDYIPGPCRPGPHPLTPVRPPWRTTHFIAVPPVGYQGASPNRLSIRMGPVGQFAVPYARTPGRHTRKRYKI